MALWAYSQEGRDPPTVVHAHATHSMVVSAALFRGWVSRTYIRKCLCLLEWHRTGEKDGVCESIVLHLSVQGVYCLSLDPCRVRPWLYPDPLQTIWVGSGPLLLCCGGLGYKEVGELRCLILSWSGSVWFRSRWCCERANIHRAPPTVPTVSSRGWSLCELEWRLQYCNPSSISTGRALYQGGPVVPAPLAEEGVGYRQRWMPYILWGCTYLVGTSWLAGYIYANLSGRTRACDWRGVLPIESSRGLRLCL